MPKKQETTFKPAAQPFKLRVALRSAPSAQQSSDDEDAQGEQKTTSNREKGSGKPSRARAKKHVKFENDERAVTGPSHPEEPEFDVADCFLAKREQNIRANKAMVRKKHRTSNTAFN